MTKEPEGSMTGTTIQLTLPQWCQNLSANMQTIKENDKLSGLICKTYPNCWKLSKLKTYIINGGKELGELVNECKLPPDQIIHIANNTLYDYNFVGTSVCIGCHEYTQTNKPCLIISGGPSFKKYNHLDLLKEFGFNGDIIVVDSALKNVLEKGVIPKYVNSIDSSNYIKTQFDYDIVRKYSNKITGLFSTVVHPSVIDAFKGKKIFYNAYINEEYSHIFFLLTNTMQVSPCGNVGSTSMMLAAVLGYNPIILTGMDLSFETENDMKQYYLNNYSYYNPNNLQKDWTKIKYTKSINPVYNKEYYIDSIFKSYKTATLNILVKLSKCGITLINCSEQGAIYSEYIQNIRFADYLKNQT